MAANPYVGAWRAWDERYADPVLGKRNWQIVAGGLLLICLVLAIGMVWLASRVRYVVYAVQVDKLGYALAEAQPLTASTSSDAMDRIERYEVATFIREARGVSSDAQAEQERLNALLAHARGAADHFLTSITTPIPRITLSRSRRSRPSRFSSIPFLNFRRRATKSAGPKFGAI
jgi:type IV secretory pathway TrbF-like protein